MSDIPQPACALHAGSRWLAAFHSPVTPTKPPTQSPDPSRRLATALAGMTWPGGGLGISWPERAFASIHPPIFSPRTRPSELSARFDAHGGAVHLSVKGLRHWCNAAVAPHARSSSGSPRYQAGPREQCIFVRSSASGVGERPCHASGTVFVRVWLSCMISLLAGRNHD
jgi:hypothetical protein